MRPMPTSRLKRRMNELECGLITTILILVVLLLVTTLGVVDDESFQGPRAFLPPRGESSNSRLASTRVETDDTNRDAGGSSKSLQNDVDRTRKTLENQNQGVNNEQRKKVDAELATGVDDDDLDATYFLPGTLELNRTDVLHKCYIPSTQKLPHGQGCSVSDKYKIVFHLTPKSGSSTGRHVIKTDFQGVDHFSETACQAPNEPDHDEWIEVAVLRNPATRAFASYEEMFVRRLGVPEMIPQSCRAFMEPFRGWIYKNYSALFDTVDGVRMLNDAYEQFMKDWNGDAFDMHLESQVAYNMRKRPGSLRHDSHHLRFVFDTHSMEKSFEKLANMVHLNKKPKVIKGRAYPRRLNVSHVSDEAFQAMCQRYRDDFCCLNYQLPPQCLRNVPLGKRVRCKWMSLEGVDEDLIQAVVV